MLRSLPSRHSVSRIKSFLQSFKGSRKMSWFPHETQKVSENLYFQERETQLMMLSNPETATGMVPFSEVSYTEQSDINLLNENDFLEQQLLLSLALMASPESALGVFHSGEVLKDDMKEQLLQTEDLPKTLTEALDDPRPMVVTSMEPPFSVVNVNEAWVGLCGYTKEEATNHSIGSLLQGPETELDVAKRMISQVKTQQYSQATLTNYTKDGREFQNHVQVGILEDDDVKYFVGILQEVQQQQQTMGIYQTQDYFNRHTF